MTTRIVPIAALAALAAVSCAQVTGIRVRAGYGWSGAINSRHLTGPELGFDLPVQKLPLVEIDFTGDWLMGGQLAHGGDLDGNVYRFMLSARAQVPGAKVSVFGGLGWATAQSRGGQFAAENGEVLQLGVGFPLGAKTPLIAPSLEVAGTFASKSGLSGFNISVAVHF